MSRAARATHWACASLLLCAHAVLAADAVPDYLFGTWGLPAADGASSGSFFSVYAVAPDRTLAEINLNAPHWSCTVRNPVWDAAENRFEIGVDVAWNAAAQRLEWQASADDASKGRCKLGVTPHEGRLDVAFECAYDCAGGVHTQTLERLDDARLIPPPRGNTDTFCASHDALRQALCRPGPLQQAVERSYSASQKVHGLGENADATAARDQSWDWDNHKTLLAAIDACNASSGGIACLQQRIDSAAAALEEKVAQLQHVRAAERAASDAARLELAQPQSMAWQGTWTLSNEQFVSSLVVEKCTAAGCVASIEASTNYTFGYTQRRGGCGIEDVDVAFTAADRAFGYVTAEDEDKYPQDMAAFVKYCRIDLSRDGDGVVVGVRGPGCSDRCMNVAGESARLAGRYASRQQPSFACAEDLLEMRWDEQLVCLDADLAALDRDLAAAFARAKANVRPAQRHALVKAQQAWIAQRADACENDQQRGACLLRAYRTRLEQLQQPAPADGAGTP